MSAAEGRLSSKYGLLRSPQTSSRGRTQPGRVAIRSLQEYLGVVWKYYVLPPGALVQPIVMRLPVSHAVHEDERAYSFEWLSTENQLQRSSAPKCHAAHGPSADAPR